MIEMTVGQTDSGDVGRRQSSLRERFHDILRYLDWEDLLDQLANTGRVVLPIAAYAKIKDKLLIVR